MQSTMQRIVVVGGNGYIGSAICKAALTRGMEVTSLSSSGQPYKTPKGHTPAWVERVSWQKANALQPSTYAHILSGAHGIVHTLGTLLPGGGYKEKLRSGDHLGLLSDAVNAISGGRIGGPNPLDESAQDSSYERMNRDSALKMCETFAASESPANHNGPRPFVYISAEDVMRPLVPHGYIHSKREAEQGIALMLRSRADLRPVFIRPSLVYHAHLRPLTSIPAAALDLSVYLHKNVPSFLPTPAGALRLLASATGGLSSPFTSMSNALTIPPIHVDQVAEAVALALDASATEVRGVVGVEDMRRLIGWTTPAPGQSAPTHA